MRHLFLVSLSLILASCGLGPAKFEPQAPPSTPYSVTEENEIKLTVDVASDGTARLDGKKYRIPGDLEKLRAVILSERGTRERFAVAVRANKTVKMDWILAVIDELKTIEGVIVGIQSETGQ